MNILTTLFLFISYALFVAMYNGSEGSGNQFPTFNPPATGFTSIGGCNWFTLCANVLADVVLLIAEGVIYVVLLLIEIIRMLVAVVTLIVTNAFQGFSGAPSWVNGLFLCAIFGGFAIAIYKSIRKGDTDSS